MQRLLMLGMNHSTAPLALREKLAFSAASIREALQTFRAKFPESEIAIISTCNRMEVYTARPVHGHPRSEEIASFLSEFHRVPVGDFRSKLYEKTDRDVAHHLFNVASSLDSMVLGETQILGQVRDAYDMASESASVGAMLNPLFQRALAVGKQVMSQTAISEGNLSVASVAVGYAKKIFEEFQDKTVLCIGAGEMAQLVMQSFAGLSFEQLLVCNRDMTKAEGLARQFNGRAAPFNRLSENLAQADIVITSTGSQLPIITRAEFEQILKQRRYRPIFLIDIALPRDVEESVGDLEHVYLYNIDDLQNAIVGNQQQRQGAVDAARQIVAREVEEFIVWSRTRELGPMIEQLYSRYHRIAQEELARTFNKLPDLSAEERQHLEELARRLVNKLLHDPIQMLKSSENPHGMAGQYIHAMEKLFKLADTSDEGMST